MDWEERQRMIQQQERGNEPGEEQALMLPKKKAPVAALAALVSTIAAVGFGVWAFKLHHQRNQARDDLDKALTEKKSLSDALELHRSQKQDAETKLTACTDNLTTVDKERTEVQTDLDQCQSGYKDLKEQTQETKAQLAEFQQLTGKFKNMIDTGKLEVVFRKGRMVVKLPAAVLFPSASDQLSDGGKAALAEVAGILKQMRDRHFTVAGHTDNIPVSTKEFESNWELSTARAVKVTEMLVAKGVPARNLVASGYGPYDPVATNGSAAGRQKNRRIEIVLEPNLNLKAVAAAVDARAPKKAPAPKPKVPPKAAAKK